MKLARRDAIRCAVALLYLLALLGPSGARAQDASDAQSQPPPLGTEQLQQLVAPIALYPDSLVAQILMASTYPLEVVEAARWVKANPKVTGNALEDAMQKQTWDASVKSLTAFPQVLEMMDQKLDWTTDLGNAFLAQQADVMNAIQALRAKAQAAGNLKSTEQQTVTVEQQPSGSQPQTIVIQPANPQVVYVPAYNPATVYGPWPYPAYPPYPYYPPGYAVVGSMISFGVGMAVGAALWGNCNWGGGNVNINTNNYNNFNKTNIKNGNWQHNAANRRGVPYNNQSLNNRYGRNTQANAQSRDQFRGRAEQGRQQIARGDANQFKGQGNRGGAQTLGQGGANRGANTLGAGSGPRQGNRDLGQQRGGGSNGNRQAGREAGAFGGVGNGGQVRREADRGRASQQRASSFSGGGNRGGGGGGGGGGYRGGGGGGGARGGGGGGARGGGGGRGGRR